MQQVNMPDEERVYSAIIEALKNNPRGMSMKQIAESVGVNRITMARYLDTLQMSGRVEMEPQGPAKLYYLSHRVPISAMLDFSSDFVVVLDTRQKIVQANAKFLQLVEKTRDELADEPLNRILRPDSTEQDLDAAITRALEGKEVVEEIRIRKGEENLSFRMKIVPTVFTDGSPGVTLILDDVTEYQRSLNALLESERKYRLLVENIGELLVNMERLDQLNNQVRNPLQAIVGLADLEGGELADVIYKQAKEIDTIVQELDLGWRSSEKIRDFVKRFSGVSKEE
jgi:PAS domain S-box-containing protein